MHITFLTGRVSDTYSGGDNLVILPPLQSVICFNSKREWNGMGKQAIKKYRYSHSIYEVEVREGLTGFGSILWRRQAALGRIVCGFQQ